MRSEKDIQNTINLIKSQWLSRIEKEFERKFDSWEDSFDRYFYIKGLIKDCHKEIDEFKNKLKTKNITS